MGPPEAAAIFEVTPSEASKKGNTTAQPTATRCPTRGKDHPGDDDGLETNASEDAGGESEGHTGVSGKDV